jgi:hypothetical protein
MSYTLLHGGLQPQFHITGWKYRNPALYIYLPLNHKEATKLQQKLKVEPSFIQRSLYVLAILFISL